MKNKTNDELRREYLRKVLDTNGQAKVTVWGFYTATGEGCVGMLGYWTVKSEAEIKQRIIKHFGEYFGRCCQYAVGFMTQETLRKNPDYLGWIGWESDFNQLDTELLSSQMSKRISSNLFSIDHTQMTSWNGS